MECERAGTLRAYLDGELDQTTARRVREHLLACTACRTRLDQLRATAVRVGAQLELLAPPSEVTSEEAIARAWTALQARLDHAASAPEPPPVVLEHKVGRIERIYSMMIQALTLRQRAAIAAAFVAVIVAGMAVIPGGRALAGDLLSLFRVQRIQVVTVDPQQPITALKHLKNLGTITPESDVDHAMQPRTVASIDEAAAMVGMPIQRPTQLPEGLSDAPSIMVTTATELSFTVDRQKAEAYLQSVGAPNPTVPPQLDGARLTVSMPAAVLLEYSDDSRQKLLGIGQMASPTAEVDGNATLADMREFLLNVPGLPEDTVRQLRAIDDWTTTLPLPIRVDRHIWRETTLNGAQALVFSDPALKVSAIIWLRDRVIHGVAGNFSQQ